MAKISVKEFATELQKACEEYANITTINVQEAVAQVAKGATQAVKDKAFAYGWEEYPKDITSTKTNNANGANAWVYVKGTNYRLAHLLENGHATRYGGRTQGKKERTEEFKHFEEGEKYVNSEYEKILKGKL